MNRFPPYEPDRSIYTSGQNIANVIPVADGWGPLPDLTVVSSALPSAPLGAFYARTSSGTYRLFVGTETAIYELDTSTYGWTDVSRLAGGAYQVPEGDEWDAELFGSSLIMTNIGDVVQFINVDTGTNFAALAGSPPQAKYVWGTSDYLVLGNHVGFPNRIQTSGFNDAAFWTVGQKGCDFQDLTTGEEVMGGIGMEKGAYIIQRTQIHSMTIVNQGEFSFRTDVVNEARGTVSPLSIATIGPGKFVYYSPDGFFMGVEGTPIGAERVDSTFDGLISHSYIHTVKAMADPFQKIVWFQAQKPDTTKFLFGYHWGLDRWCYADSNLSGMASLATPAVTIDGLDAFFAVIDDASIPFDSRLLTGGDPTMAVFDTSYRLCYLTGLPRAATLDTVDAELNPGFRSYLQEAVVAGNCPTYTLAPITSDKFGGTRTVGTAVTPHSSTGISHFRSDAKFHAFRMAIAAGVVWNHVMGVDEIRAKRTGRR